MEWQREDGMWIAFAGRLTDCRPPFWGEMVTVSARVHYAVLAALALAASHETGRPVPLRELSDLGIPTQFLAQIFQQLKAAGLVQSTRGPSGGYQLARSPNRITAWDIVSAIEPAEARVPVTEGLAATVTNLWQQIRLARQELLAETTLDGLLRAAEQRSESMYYI